MKAYTRNKFLGLGFDTNLINKIGAKGLNLTGVRGLNRKALENYGFTKKETDFILDNVHRKPLRSEVVASLVNKSGGICAYHADGNGTRPFQIHHMIEHHISQNDEEENLMILCPNHHVSVHKNKVSLQEQILTKISWEKLWEIAKHCNKQGISFPFSSFQYVNFSNQPDITEVFNLSSPSPSTCKILSSNAVGEEAMAVLSEHNYLVLSGASGNGKSTLAYGISGRLKGFDVYEYASANRGEMAVKEIMLFLTQSVKKVALVIDDSNTSNFVTQKHLELGLKFCSDEKKIIVVNTRDTFKGVGSLEEHNVNQTVFIDWNRLREGVLCALLDSEVAVIKYLQKNNADDFGGYKIGHGGLLQNNLKYVIKSYSSSSENVWQLMYLLGGGANRVDRIYTELSSCDCFHIVFAYIALKQISLVENGVSLEEVLSLYSIHPSLKSSGQPEPSWLERSLNDLLQRRILIVKRGRYVTVHREFAKKYLEYAFKQEAREIEAILDNIFTDLTNAKEILILWSWFRISAIGGYIRSWYSAPNFDWSLLIDSAVEEGLSVTAGIYHQMNIAFTRNSNLFIETSSHRGKELARLVNESEAGTLHYFREILGVLKNHCELIIVEVVQEVEHGKIVDLIKDAQPYEFEGLMWLLNIIRDYSPSHIRYYSDHLSFDDCAIAIERCTRGDLNGIHDITKFYRYFILDMDRHQFQVPLDAMTKALDNVELSELKVPTLFHMGFPELLFMPNEIDKILDSIDAQRMAEEYVSVPPRFWTPLLQLSMFSNYGRTQKIRNIVDSLDHKRLIENLSLYHREYLYEFRILIHQLKYGSARTKNEWGSLIEPMIDQALIGLKDPTKNNDVLNAFYQLAPKRAKKLAKKYGVDIDAKKNKSISIPNKTLSKIEEMERNGVNYELEILRV